MGVRAPVRISFLYLVMISSERTEIARSSGLVGNQGPYITERASPIVTGAVYVQVQILRLLQGWWRNAILFQHALRTGCGRDNRRCLHAFWDLIRCLKNKESLSSFPKLHSMVLFDIVDFEFHLHMLQCQNGSFTADRSG